MPELQTHIATPPLRCAGIGLRGSGYPNAANTIRRLRAAGMQIDDRTDWLSEGFQLWKATRGRLSERLALYLRLSGGTLLAAWRLCFLSIRDRRITYVPYPAIFLLWWLSWIPRRWCPPLVADAYISVWDSTVQDRALLGAGGLIGRILRSFEGRALRTADAVLVDTRANRHWMIEAFGLIPKRVHAIPLAIDDADLLETPAVEPRNPLQALYVGTFVPLHGVNVLVGAMRQALADGGTRFHLVGDGQDAAKVEMLQAENPRAFTWERNWLSHPQITERISQCDVCLGVFGGPSKAARVLPFKLYLALAAGKAIITQQEFSLPEGVPDPPFIAIPPDPTHLADHLAKLARDPEKTMRAGREGRAFYRQWLGEQAMLSAWNKVLESLTKTAR